MIIKMLGADLMLEDESRDDEEFNVTLDEDRARLYVAVIESIHDLYGNEIELEDIDFMWANGIAQVELADKLDQVKIDRDASRMEIDV